MARDHLIIPDSHAKPGISNRRFEWLGNYIVENQPSVIIDIGDSADMPSLCKYDVGQVVAEGRRYSADIKAYHNAQEKLFAPLHKYNNTSSKKKKKRYKPLLIKVRGNHEHRINRAANENPALFGHISTDDLREAEFGWDTYEFLDTACIDNIAYCHYFTSGIMGRPIGGVNHARTLVLKNYMSSVCGHSHMRDFWEDTDVIGRKVFGCVVGCYFEHDEEYTSENHRFWRGITHLQDVRDGQADPSFISIAEMRRNYG